METACDGKAAQLALQCRQRAKGIAGAVGFHDGVLVLDACGIGYFLFRPCMGVARNQDSRTIHLDEFAFCARPAV